jgi:hypothetical protein
MLEIVQEEEEMTRPQDVLDGLMERLPLCLWQIERAGNRRGDVLGVSQWRQRHE